MWLDHFHPPLSNIRSWQGFHHTWAANIAEHLNRQLVPPWHAEPHLCFGLEIDVAGLQRQLPEPLSRSQRPRSFYPLPPHMTVPLPELEDSLEVEVIRTEGEREIVAAVELVGPAHKNRAERREAFIAKCESLLSQGVGLVVADIVTEPDANLHAALLERLGAVAQGSSGALYAASYHPIRHDSRASVDIWFEPLKIGSNVSIPDMPLFLRDGPCVAVALHHTYQRACAQLKIFRDLRILETSQQQTEHEHSR